MLIMLKKKLNKMHYLEHCSCCANKKWKIKKQKNVQITNKNGTRTLLMRSFVGISDISMPYDK